MATGYTRQSGSEIVTGQTIDAADLNAEFNQVQSAMDATNGHDHDGTVGGGAKIKPTALNNIAANGIVARTSTTNFNARTITGAANEISIANGDGVSGNPTVSLATALTLTGKTITGGNITADSFACPDDMFTITDNADITKKIAFQASGIGAGTTRTFTAPDKDGTLAVLSDLTAGYQPLDATLTALAGHNSNGVLTQIAADTFIGRSIVGTANEITVVNGDGVAGNYTLSLPTAMTMNGKTLTGGVYDLPQTLNVHDANMGIVDNADVTKIAKFESSGITTGTTRTFTFPNENGTFALAANVLALTGGALTGALTSTSTGTFAGNVDMNGGFTATATAPTGYAGILLADGDAGTDYTALHFRSNSGTGRGSVWTPANAGDLHVSGDSNVILRTGNAGVTGGNEKLRIRSDTVIQQTGEAYVMSSGTANPVFVELVNNNSAGQGCFFYNDGANPNNCRLQNAEAGSTTLWTDNTLRMNITTTGAIICSSGIATAGTTIFDVNDFVRDCFRVGAGADGTTYNGLATILYVRQATGSGRSINAAGTINASGADYAEYEIKGDNCKDVEKGEIIGFDVDGKITKVFDDSISFGVKSTNPNLVGGDSWANILGEVPIEPKLELSADIVGTAPEDIESKEYKEWEKTSKALIEKEKASKSAYEIALKKYNKDIEEYNVKLEIERAKYDRIAYCGKCPVNITDAKVGDYVIPVKKGKDISYKLTNKPAFEESLVSVGRVRRILEDGRAEIVVSP